MVRKKYKVLLFVCLFVMYAIGMINANKRLTYLEYTTVNEKNDTCIILDTNGDELKQEFVMPYDILNSVSILVGTFDRDNNSTWVFSLLDSTGKVLYEDAFNASVVVDNEYYRHKLDRNLNVTKGETYYISIRAKNVSDLSSLAYFVSEGKNVGESSLIYNGETMAHTLCFKIYGGDRDFWWHGFTTLVFLYTMIAACRLYFCYKKGKQVSEDKFLKGMVLGAIVFLLLSSFAAIGSFTDENDNMRGGMVIANGGVLYKDYVTQHTPVVYYLCSIFAVLGAGSIEQFRLSYYIFISLVWMLLYIRHQDFFGKKKMLILPMLETIFILSMIYPQGHQVLSDGFQGILFTVLMLEFLRYYEDHHLKWDRSVIISICIWGSFGAAFVSAFAIVFLALIFVGIEIVYLLETKSNITCIFARYYKLAIAMVVPPILAMIYFKVNNALYLAFEQFYTFNREVYPYYTSGLGNNVVQPFINGMQNFLNVIADNFNAILRGAVNNITILQLTLIVLAVSIIIKLIEKKQFVVSLSFGLMIVFSATRGYGFHGLAAWYLMVLIIVLYIDLFAETLNKIGKPSLCVFTIYLASTFLVTVGDNLLREQESVSELESRIVDMTEMDTNKDIFLDAYCCDSLYLFYKDRKPINPAVYMLPWYMDWYELDNIGALVDNLPRVVVYNEDRKTWGIGHYTFAFDNELMMYYTRLGNEDWEYNIWIKNENT